MLDNLARLVLGVFVIAIASGIGYITFIEPTLALIFFVGPLFGLAIMWAYERLHKDTDELT